MYKGILVEDVMLYTSGLALTFHEQDEKHLSKGRYSEDPAFAAECGAPGYR